MRDYISKARDLLDQIWHDKEVNIISKNHVVNKRKFDLIDISLRGSKYQMEQKYSRSIFYRNNIRQTNTIIENQKNKYSEFVRKGIPIIPSLKLKYVHQMRKKNQNLSKIEKNITQIIFEGVSTAFYQQKKVQLIKVEKVRGISIEVSYNYQFDAWIICSGNVSLLAYTVEDLKIYRSQRYQSATKVGQIWFDLITKLNNKEMSALRKLLNGYTAIGRYNNISDKQQLIKCNKQLKWFAIVDNFSNQFCMNPFKAKKQLQSFGLIFAKIKNISLTSSSQIFYNALEELHIKTSESGLEDQQFGMQGSIVYFISYEPIKKGIFQQRVIGAAKIQTLQFKFFMKIKKELLNYNTLINRQKNDRDYLPIVENYRRQLQLLQKQNMSNAPYPLQYYQKILQKCLQLVTFTIINNHLIENKFQTFLKIIFYALYKRIFLKKYGAHMLADQQFISKIKQISFKQYGGLGCRTKIVYLIIGLPGMFKTYLGKQLSLHFCQLNLPFRLISIDFINGSNQKYKYIKQVCINQQDNKKSIQHFYLDGSFDSQTTYYFIKQIKKAQSKDTLLKFILIKDQTNSPFRCLDQNLYPFDIRTIIMCYYGQNSQKNITLNPSIEQRVKNLSIVTQKLKKSANFNESIGRLNIQEYYFPFNKKMKIQDIQQYETLVKQILKANDQKTQYFFYAKLITKLEHLNSIEFLSEEQMRNETQYLIKSSYPIIPIISFKRSVDQQ